MKRKRSDNDKQTSRGYNKKNSYWDPQKRQGIPSRLRTLFVMFKS